MGIPSGSNTVAWWLAIAHQEGLGGAASDPFNSYYANIVAQAGQGTGDTSTDQTVWAAWCEACLRSRGLVNAEIALTGAPPCGQPPSVDVAQQVGLTAAGGAAGVIPGLGAAVGALEDIFTAHSVAVNLEDSVACSVCAEFNSEIGQIDAAVRTGEITPTQGVAYVSSLASQLIAVLQPHSKKGDGYTGYMCCLRAHVAFAPIFYAGTAPGNVVQPLAPGKAPTALGSLPGQVPSSLANPSPAILTSGGYSGTARATITSAGIQTSSLMPAPAVESAVAESSTSKILVVVLVVLGLGALVFFVGHA
jgi:hypothetical protein